MSESVIINFAMNLKQNTTERSSFLIAKSLEST